MDSKEKKALSESDIKAKFITPALVKAGWDEMTQIRREVTLTPGPAYNFLEKSKLFEGDIIMNKIGDPGAAFFVLDRGKPMSLAMNLFLLRPLLSNKQYPYLFLKASYKYVQSFS